MPPATRFVYRHVGLLFTLSLLLPGCAGGSPAPRARAPVAPGTQAKCRVAATKSNPLVTEWPASEKANLESRLLEGGVVVAYSGCELRMLNSCRVAGRYDWQRTTTATDVIDIRSEDELYAKLPLGAAALEGELRSSGRLAMATTVSGQLNLVGLDPGRVPVTGNCEGATHLVRGLTVGAFELRAGGTLETGGGVSVAGVEAGAATQSQELVVRRAGAPGSCSGGTADAPAAECSSPIQVFLEPLPGTLANMPPSGTVRMRFVTGHPEMTWEVLRDDEIMCETPCVRDLPPKTAISFREKDPPFLQRAQRLSGPDLAQLPGEDHVEIRANPRAPAEFVGGILITTFSGLAVAAGVTLTAVGCGGESSGRCVGGLITLPIGLGGLIPGIWMIVDASPEATATPTAPGPPPGPNLEALGRRVSGLRFGGKFW